jgi:magnesium-dependent phosphatase-1
MLVIFDGDGTLWNGDVLAGYLTTPLRQIDDDTVEDHQGKRVKLKEHVREVLDALRDKDIYVALASENRKLPVVALLQRLKLGQYFNFLEVSWTEKDEMILKILQIFIEKGKETGKVFFIDDFEYNIEIVQENPLLKHIICVNASQLQSLKDVLKIVGDATQTE